MKVTLLVLSFLVAYLIWRKEACTTFTQKQSRIDPVKMAYSIPENAKRPPPETCNLLIIGAGPQAVALLAQLLQQGMPFPLTIVIVEKKPTFGTGLPFDENIATPEHLLNLFSASMVSITGKAQDFLTWIQHTPTPLPADFYELSRKGASSTPPARIIIGKYLTERFAEYVVKCIDDGHHDVVVASSTTATNISLHETRLFEVELSTGVSIKAEDVFLATGHWYRSRHFEKTPKGYHKSPWPSSTLKREIHATHIAIFGTSLSAIDAVLTLAHHFGVFSKGDTVYKPNPGNEKFRITMYSRSGQLPRIAASRLETTAFTYRPKYMTPEKIEELTGGNNGVGFKTTLEQLKKDLIDLDQDIANVEDIDTLTNKEFFSRLDRKLQSKHPEQVFFDDMENKMSQLDIKVHELFIKSGALFGRYLGYFTTEERLIYDKYIAPRIQKALNRVPMTNAIKLHTLMQRGYLNLTAVGSDSHVTETGDGQGVRVTYEGHEPVDHEYFIDATGQSGQISKDPRKLTQALLQSGLAQSNLLFYENQEDALKVYDGLDSEDIDGVDKRRTVKIGDGLFYESDGVEMEKERMRVIPESGKSPRGNLYASIPFTFGFDPGVQDLETVVRIAEKAVAHMKSVRLTNAGLDYDDN